MILGHGYNFPYIRSVFFQFNTIQMKETFIKTDIKNGSGKDNAKIWGWGSRGDLVKVRTLKLCFDIISDIRENCKNCTKNFRYPFQPDSTNLSIYLVLLFWLNYYFWVWVKEIYFNTYSLKANSFTLSHFNCQNQEINTDRMLLSNL